MRFQASSVKSRAGSRRRSSLMACDQGLLVPGTEPPDRLTDRPGGEGVGVAQGFVQSGSRRTIAELAQGDRRLAPHGRITIVQKRLQSAEVPRAGRGFRPIAPPASRTCAAGSASIEPIASRASSPPIASSAQRACSLPVSGSGCLSRSTSRGTASVAAPCQAALRFQSNREGWVVERRDQCCVVLAVRVAARRAAWLLTSRR